MSLIGEHTAGETYGDRNLVIDEALTVTYSKQLIQGSWGYTAANVSGYYNYMNEYHRYARKSFKYVGMKYATAVTCRDDMIKYFKREFYVDVWNGTVMGGQWDQTKGGEVLMADVSLVRDEGDSWSVHVRVNEDDVRYYMAGTTVRLKTVFSKARSRKYGTDGAGNADEVENDATVDSDVES
jgi:hypothetical protein